MNNTTGNNNTSINTISFFCKNHKMTKIQVGVF